MTKHSSSIKHLLLVICFAALTIHSSKLSEYNVNSVQAYQFDDLSFIEDPELLNLNDNSVLTLTKLGLKMRLSIFTRVPTKTLFSMSELEATSQNDGWKEDEDTLHFAAPGIPAITFSFLFSVEDQLKAYNYSHFVDIYEYCTGKDEIMSFLNEVKWNPSLLEEFNKISNQMWYASYKKETNDVVFEQLNAAMVNTITEDEVYAAVPFLEDFDNEKMGDSLFEAAKRINDDFQKHFIKEKNSLNFSLPELPYIFTTDTRNQKEKVLDDIRNQYTNQILITMDTFTETHSDTFKNVTQREACSTEFENTKSLLMKGFKSEIVEPLTSIQNPVINLILSYYQDIENKYTMGTVSNLIQKEAEFINGSVYNNTLKDMLLNMVNRAVYMKIDSIINKNAIEEKCSEEINTYFKILFSKFTHIITYAKDYNEETYEQGNYLNDHFVVKMYENTSLMGLIIAQSLTPLTERAVDEFMQSDAFTQYNLFNSLDGLFENIKTFYNGLGLMVGPNRRRTETNASFTLSDERILI